MKLIFLCKVPCSCMYSSKLYVSVSTVILNTTKAIYIYTVYTNLVKGVQDKSTWDIVSQNE